MKTSDEFSGIPSDCGLSELQATVESQLTRIAASFDTHPNAVLVVFQSISGVELKEKQLIAAKAAGLEVAAQGEPTVRALVDRWASVDGLGEFAAAVTRTMLPA
ncbi:hypothetical protein [Pseudomonas sp. 2FE]|uniref:hypothetical protein n=1 Tax=Pseudomonas sp. 2FE TaxID=2502190 RepID=UPI0010F7C24E|nr:hypothetical protein [Pseudomonas sp. 2FE]